MSSISTRNRIDGFKEVDQDITGNAQAEKNTYLPSPIITIDNVLKYYNPEGEF